MAALDRQVEGVGYRNDTLHYINPECGTEIAICSTHTRPSEDIVWLQVDCYWWFRSLECGGGTLVNAVACLKNSKDVVQSQPSVKRSQCSMRMDSETGVYRTSVCALYY